MAMRVMGDKCMVRLVRRASMVLGLGLLSAGVAGCEPTAGADRRGPTVVDVAMDEYNFHFDDGEIAAGLAVFRAENRGELKHELVLVRVPPNAPSIEKMIDSGRMLETLAHLAPRPPGEKGVFAVDLGTGRYGMLCFVSDAGGEAHIKKGMHAEFTVR